MANSSKEAKNPLGEKSMVEGQIRGYFLDSAEKQREKAGNRLTRFRANRSTVTAEL